MRRFTVLCVYYTISFVESTLHTNSRFVGYPGLDNIVFEEDILESIQSDSPILCCAICKGNSSCLSVYYNNYNKICTLYSKVFKPFETGLTSEAGLKYHYYTDETNGTSSTMDVATTSKTLQTTQGSSPASQVDESSNLANQRITNYYSEIRPGAFEIAYHLCMDNCEPDMCHLVWIDTGLENDKVAQTVQASHYRDDCFFIGHVFNGDEIEYHSLQGHDKPPPPTFQGQFVYRNDSLGCTAILSSGNWTSVNCNTERPSICEHEVKSIPRG